MSKIICDVCGTSYPETATQCPICGCVRPGDMRVVAGDTNEPETQAAGNYTYVKGGRFSKSNVKKRTRAAQVVPGETTDQSQEPAKEASKKDTPLIITVVVLILAIIAVVAYIAVRVFFPGTLIGGSDASTNGTSQSADASSSETTQTTVLEIPCAAITLSKTVIEFDKAGAALLLNVTTDPANTTDEIEFASTDANVATVTQDGKVVAVGPGQAIITVTCGQAAAECRVACNFEGETPTETTSSETYSTDDFKFNRKDFTLTRKGDSHILYAGDIPVESITWTTDDASVATIENGKVVAVGSGTTTVYGEYGGVKLSCVVRCAKSVGTAETSSSNTSENNGTQSTSYSISKTDVTINVGEEFTIQLLDSDRKAVSVTWTVEKADICSVSGNTVKGLASGTTKVSVTYEGVTYTCTVRVR